MAQPDQSPRLVEPEPDDDILTSSPDAAPTLEPVASGSRERIGQRNQVLKAQSNCDRAARTGLVLYGRSTCAAKPSRVQGLRLMFRRSRANFLRRMRL